MPNHPEFHLRVSHVKYNVHQKGHQQQLDEFDPKELYRENLTEFISLNKTHNHREYEAYCVNEGLLGKGIPTKTQESQTKFDRDRFYIFQVHKGDQLINEWVLYDWILEEYFENSQEIIRLSTEKSQNDKKFFFVA